MNFSVLDHYYSLSNSFKLFKKINKIPILFISNLLGDLDLLRDRDLRRSFDSLAPGEYDFLGGL